jgi:hypothetical protein
MFDVAKAYWLYESRIHLPTTVPESVWNRPFPSQQADQIEQVNFPTMGDSRLTKASDFVVRYSSCRLRKSKCGQLF